MLRHVNRVLRVEATQLENSGLLHHWERTKCADLASPAARRVHEPRGTNDLIFHLTPSFKGLEPPQNPGRFSRTLSLRLGLYDGTGQTLVMHRYGGQAFKPWHCGVAPYLCSRRKLVSLVDAAQAQVQDFGRTFTLSGVQLSSALGAEGLYSLVSAFCDLDVVLGRARYFNALRRGREHSTKRRAREGLTVRAMADQDSMWVYGCGKGDCAAMALA